MDQGVFFLINHDWASPALDRAMAVASSWSLWWPLAVVAFVAVALAGGFRARAMLVTICLAVAVSDGIVVRLLKDVVARPRPYQAVQGVRMIDLERAKPRLLAITKPLRESYSGVPTPHMHGRSFPSSHAANNFAIATVVLCFYRRWGWLAYLPAAVVALSRVYVGSHWPLDVLSGALIGALIGWLAVRALDLVWRRWGGRLAPRAFESHPSLVPA